MKEVTYTKYRCEVCGATFDNAEAALECEAQPVMQDKGVKPGDRVKVLTGDGRGMIAVVDKVYPLSRAVVHHMWRRYWHTVAITVEFSDRTMRWCTFDEYEVLP